MSASPQTLGVAASLAPLTCIRGGDHAEYGGVVPSCLRRSAARWEGVVPVGELVLDRPIGPHDAERAGSVGLGDLAPVIHRSGLEDVAREHLPLISDLPPQKFINVSNFRGQDASRRMLDRRETS